MNKILMVPACEISEKDKISNTETESRCVSALIKWQTGRYTKLLLCGGIFLPPHLQTRPAADLMAEWFRREGVTSKDILIDDLSRDSFENAFFGLKKLEDNNYHTKKGNEVKNRDLIIQFYECLDRFDVSMLRVEGHAKKGQSRITDYHREVDKLSRKLVRQKIRGR